MSSFSSRALYRLRLLLIFSLLSGLLSAPNVQAGPAVQVATPTITPTITPADTETPTSTALASATSTATETPVLPPTDTPPNGYPIPVDTSTPPVSVTDTVTASPSPTLPLTPTATVLPSPTPVGEIITSAGGEIVYGQSGKDSLTLDFPAGALDKAVDVSVAALDKLPAELPQDVWYKDYGVDVKINDLADGVKVDKTSQPVTITLQYTGLPIDFGNETSQKLLALYHFNEKEQMWERLWTTVDPASGVLTATLSSFSPVVLTSGTQTNTGDFAKPWQPGVQSFQVDQFTGAATWSIPVEAPSGRSGLGGGLSLEYSSAMVDEMHGANNPQSPGIGTGWSLGGVGYIERKIVRDVSGTGTPQVYANGNDTFHLVLNGVSSDLVCVDMSVTPCVEYRTKDERFWRVRKLIGAPNESQLSGIPGLKGEYWTVTVTDGMTYRFGWSGDSCRYNNTVPNPNPNGCSSAYAANEGELSAFYMYGKEIGGPTPNNISAYIWRWNLDRIETPHHDVVSYYYTREYNDYYVCNGNDPIANCWYGVDGLNNINALPYFYATTPNNITWQITNNNLHSIPLTAGGATLGYTRGGYLRQVTYTRGNGLPAPYNLLLNIQTNADFYPDALDAYQGSNGRWPQSVQTFWTKAVYKSIDVQANPSAGSGQAGQVIRHYTLNNNGGSDFLLNSVQVTGSDGTSTLPPIQFGYLAYHISRNTNCSTGADNADQNYWLDTVTTPYSGTVNFNYTGPIAPASSPKFISQNGQTCDPLADITRNSVHWLRYRVREVTVNPSIGQKMYSVYEYRNSANTAADPGLWAGTYITDTTTPREFRGQPVVRVFQIDPSAGNDTAIAYQDTWFHQGLTTTVSICNQTVTDYDGMQGRSYKSITYDANNTQLAQSTTAYQFTDFGGGRHFIAPKAECQHAQPGSNTNSTRTEYSYDSTYSNLTQKREYTQADAIVPYRTTAITYTTPNTTTWLISQPWKQQVFAGTAITGTEVSRVEYCYDRDGQGNPLCNGTTLTFGDLTKQDAIELQTSAHAITQNWYDAYGHVVQAQDPLGYISTITYETTYQQFPIQTCNALNQCSTTEYYGVNGASLDGGTFGQVRRTWDANGQTTATQYLYDPFSRLTKVIRPGDDVANPTVQYNYLDASAPFKIETWQRTNSGCGSCVQPTFQFYDGIGRPLQTRAQMGDGSIQSVTNVVYDALGRQQKNYLAAQEVYTDTFSRPAGWDIQPNTLTQYDALNRVTQVTNSDNTTIKTTYSGWQTGVLDANGHQRINQADALGRITTVKEFTQTLSTVNFNLTPIYATTQYGYDTSDHLTGVMDTLTNTTVITYNTLGFKTAMLDPDMGQWNYTYDLAGNLIQQTDAKGQTLWFKYDQFNRLIEKRQTNSTGPLLASFTYGTSAYGIGHRTVMSDTSGLTAWAYDSRGRMVSEAQTITGAGTYTTTYTYDAADSVRAITYPNGEVVGQTYNAAGQLLSVCGGLTATCNQNYVINLTYNALGQLKQLTLGNNNVTAYDYYGDGGPATNSFRLWQIKTTQAGTTVFNLQYVYDSMGNVKTITDTTNANQVQSFGYDALDRLMNAQTNAAGNGQYTESYAYNPIGNMTSKAGVAYAYQDTAHKHAVTHLGGTQKFWYDANGNMTKRIEGGVTYTQTFDIENRLVSVTTITGTTTFVYNADSNRVLQTLPNGDKTAYFGSLMEVFIPATTPLPQPTPTPSPTPTPLSLPYKVYLALIVGNPDQPPLPPTNLLPIPWGQTWKTYYYTTNQLIAMRVTSNPDSSGNGMFYVTADHLGSVSVMMDDSGNVVSRQMYLPYGQMRYASGTLPTSKAFTEQYADTSTGLAFFNARYLDTALGRFISADTLVPEAGNPQALNRFSYVFNNPLRHIDPSGYDPLDASWQAAFTEAHGRGPEWEDRLIRLFSIAFPEEWDWNQFYNPDGALNQEGFKHLRENPGTGRSWKNMPIALGRLAGWYTPSETNAFVRDVGSLFGGLLTRFEQPSAWQAVSAGCNPCHDWFGIQKTGFPWYLTGKIDWDSNVHHWAWALVLGYSQGYYGIPINTVRELTQAKYNPSLGSVGSAYESLGDIWLGNRGVAMGVDVALFGAKPATLRRLWRHDILLRWP